MYQIIFPSPLGDLIALASDSHLVMLEFIDSPKLEKKLEKYSSIEGENIILTQAKLELSEYFAGRRKHFSIPLAPSGTAFQQGAWQALTKIPYGETRSYKEEAVLAKNPKAVRAIGGANNKNPIVIIIPCHRVIGASGELVGYGGGLARKKWLLEHEKRHLPT